MMSHQSFLLHEADYILSLKEGSESAFTVIYNQYADRLYSFVLGHTKNKTISEDIVQDTFLRFWKARAILDSNRSIQSLLFTIARNSVIDTFRRQVNRVEFQDYMRWQNEQKAEVPPEESVYFDEFMERLTVAKKRLTHREREIYELSREKELTITRIAEILGISQQTVKNILTTSLKKMRRELSVAIIMLLIMGCVKSLFVNFLKMSPFS